MGFVERSLPLSQLNQAWEDAQMGNGRLVIIGGEAGIGKTTLVEKFTAPYEEMMLWGACDDFFTPRPYGPLHDIAHKTNGKLLNLLQRQADKYTLFSTFLQKLLRPTIVVIEDIHWADEVTFDLLKFLGRRIMRTPSLLLFTCRDNDGNQVARLQKLLGDLSSRPSTQRLTLSPLSVNGILSLSKTKKIDAQKLHSLTGGNPFFVTEILASDGTHYPITIRDAILARFEQLPQEGKQTLNFAALLGPRIEPWLLLKVSHGRAEAIDPCFNLGFLKIQDRYYYFQHELTRQIILDQIPPHQQMLLHQAVLQKLGAMSPMGQNSARLAHHARGARDQEVILKYAPIAAREAHKNGMLRTEAALWNLVIEYAGDWDYVQKAELYEHYALSMSANLERETAVLSFEKALEFAELGNASPLLKGRIHVHLATFISSNAQVGELVDHLDQAISYLETITPSVPLALAYKSRAFQLLIQGNTPLAVQFAEKAAQIAENQKDLPTQISAMSILGLCWIYIDHEKGCIILEQTIALTPQAKSYWQAGAIYANLSMHYVDSYQLKKAQDRIEIGLRLSDEHDNEVAELLLKSWQGMLNLYLGDWQSCKQIVNELLDLPALPLICQTTVLVCKARLLARQGNPKASELLDQALDISLKINNVQRMGVVYAARAELAWLTNNYAQLTKEIDAYLNLAVKHRQPGFAGELTYWLWQSGANVKTYDWMVPPFVLEMTGEWEKAAKLWQARGCPYEQARALSNGDVEAKKKALLIFESLDARPFFERLRSQLIASGEQSLPRGPRPTTKENPYQLTNRQLEILALLSQKLTNNEIASQLHISPRTVGHHVSAILGKLAVSSRLDAAKVGQSLFETHP